MVAFEGENVILHWYFFKKNFTKKYDDIYRNGAISIKIFIKSIKTNYTKSIYIHKFVRVIDRGKQKVLCRSPSSGHPPKRPCLTELEGEHRTYFHSTCSGSSCKFQHDCNSVCLLACS